MKDLLVYTADADAQAFMRAILNRPQAIGIRDITFDIDRHHSRDSGMVQNGPELAGMKKGRHHKILMMWDHHGSGREIRQSPEEVAINISDRLDRVTWSGNHTVAILVPELEQWLWHCENALAAYCGIDPNQLDQWIEERATKLKITVSELKSSQPKELFEYVMLNKLRRSISPRDFEEIGKKASVKALKACPTFESIISRLTSWFPA
ncbi:MAG: hypothetical protein FD176_1200 [Rhodospirillaceae bacterium]|nr:MAG: hypothetical protein FD176_1200 [Rhodospirillaceae bacterium]TNC96626.1 MAG: hypothetical protein FD119_1511 [Stygiobacter sp.]